jgi:formamidopyrimidine-DNA glycosylase
LPELPDIAAYITALQPRVVGERLKAVRLNTPFLLRSVQPALSEFESQPVQQLRRIGKRITFGFEADRWLVLHLMIAGRLHWKPAGAKLSTRQQLAAFDFPNGTLLLTEAGAQHRASLHAVQGAKALEELDPGGIEPLEATFEQFRAALSADNHTLKRALTDPRVISGVGNAYSDEILHAAQLSPIAQTQRLDENAWRKLYGAVQETLRLWVDRFNVEARQSFPEKVTAFRDGMAVHGRYGKPCPRCSSPIQRIRYAGNETNYCARCQTEGKLLADRGLSRLLGKDWPRTLEELETLKRGTR